MTAPELYDKNSWATPKWVFSALKKRFDFILDAAASDQNHKCDLFLTKEEDALKLNWRNFTGAKKTNNEAVWINPPYDNIKPWIEKAIQESVCNHYTVVMFIPATPDVGWWPRDEVDEIWFITKGRIAFEHPLTGKPVNGNTKGSAVLIFRPLHDSKITITRYVNRDDLKALANDNLVGEV